jgi:hypothetical protein
MMNLFTAREILFQGSKERLHRTVEREGGRFLGNYQFKIFWKSKHAKPLNKLPFQFRCTYRNTSNGYLITYRVCPSFTTLISIAISFLFACYVTYCAWIRDSVEVIPCLIVFFTVPVVWYTTQLRSCLSEFNETFGVVTKPRKERKK